MRYWKPPWQEVALEGLALAALPGYSLAQSIVDGRPPYFVILVTLGTVAVILTIVALWEWLRQPFRKRLLTGKELIDTIDAWLRDNGAGRTPYQMPGYSHALIATYGDANIYIGIEANRNVLAFAASRTEGDASQGLIQGIPDEKWVDAKYELSIELTRFGGYFQTAENPYAVSFWTNLPVDETLNEAQILERVDFIRRADFLVRLVAQRAAVAALFAQPATPPSTIAGMGQAAASARVSASPTVESQPQ